MKRYYSTNTKQLKRQRSKHQILFLDLVSEYQQYQDATIDDDEYFEGDEVEQEEAWTTGNSSMMQSPTPTPCRQTHENIETADELYLILPSFFPVF